MKERGIQLISQKYKGSQEITYKQLCTNKLDNLEEWINSQKYNTKQN